MCVGVCVCVLPLFHFVWQLRAPYGVVSVAVAVAVAREAYEDRLRRKQSGPARRRAAVTPAVPLPHLGGRLTAKPQHGNTANFFIRSRHMVRVFDIQ